MISEIFFLLLGVFAGTITGLTPGLHANTIALAAIIYMPEKSTNAALFIIGTSITHSFMDAIPNIILGAPSEESFLTILPGHKMLLNGKGLDAINLTILGGLITTIAAILIFPLIYSLSMNHYKIIQILVPTILALVFFQMIKNEKNKKQALIVAGLSSLTGIIALNSGTPNPIVALVTGFFAVPSLIHSITSTTRIPNQEKATEEKNPISFEPVLASAITSLIPSVGPSQASFIVKKLSKKMSAKKYLYTIGGINTGNIILSMAVLLGAGKTRTGMALALKPIIETNFDSVAVLVAGILFSAGTAAILSMIISEKLLKKTEKINYKKASTLILMLVATIVFLAAGPMGLLIAITSTAISIYANTWKVKRSIAMCFLMAPTIIHYLQFV